MNDTTTRKRLTAKLTPAEKVYWGRISEELRQYHVINAWHNGIPSAITIIANLAR